MHLSMAIFALYRMHRRDPVAAEERTTFLHGLEAANTVSNIFEDESPESETDGEVAPPTVSEEV